MNGRFTVLHFFIASLFILNSVIAQGQLYDSYGGRKDLSIDEGTGYFRLGKINGKHFLVTPEGNAFRAIGLNHSHTLTSDNYDEITANMKSMGFNSGDYQGPKWQWERIPYSKGIQLLETSTWLPENKFKFEDVFDPVFLTALENKIKNIVQVQAENANLICYFFTDVPVWEIKKYGKGWIDFYKSLSKDSPGGKHWDKWKAENPGKAENEFIRLIAKQLYSNAVAYVKKYDNNHLIFGDRYIEYHFPESALEESLPFVDGIAIQPKNILDFNFFDEVYEKYKKPIFVCDHVTSFATETYPNTMGQVADNIDDYLEIYRTSVFDVMSKPYMVGYNKCQYQDEVSGTQLKQGLYRQNGEPYGYLDSLYSVHQKALDTAYTVPPFDMEKAAAKLLDWGKYENVKKEAIQRIEKFRKGNATIKLKYLDDEVVENIFVNVKLKRHDFKWGAVVKPSFVDSPYSEKYKELFLSYFNASGFNVALKPKFRGRANEKIAEEQIMPWFIENDIYVRGHALVWEGENYLRPEDKAIYSNPALSDSIKADSLLASMGKHFHHAIPKWSVNCWDVTNESIGNNILNDLLPGMNTHAYWFKLADSLCRAHQKNDVVLYANDYQIISAISDWAQNYTKPGYNAVGRPALYREMLDEQIANGAPIGGIGFQSRLKNGLITPDSIYKRLCDFERFNLPFQGTEFEIRDNAGKYIYNNAERKLLTEYMMVMYFSHPNVNGFWHWTFADKNNTENLDYPLFNYDGTPKVNGQKWIDLMDGFFNTDLSLRTDNNGEIKIRGYYGTYHVIAQKEQETYIGSFKIDSTQTDSVIIVDLNGHYRMTGLKDSAAYETGLEIPVEISAFSSGGEIRSLSLLSNFETIKSVNDSMLGLNYTLGESKKGWNEFIIKFEDDSGNRFRHSVDVYFGDPEPVIKMLNEPDDTIYQASTGNVIEFSVHETYSAIDSVYVNFAGRDYIYTDTTGDFNYKIDSLQVGNYHFAVEVTDVDGRKTYETTVFNVVEKEDETSGKQFSYPDYVPAKVYPNPVAEMLFFDEQSSFKIYSTSGQKVIEGKQVLSVDVSALQSGLYFVKANNNTFKIIKE